MLIVKNVFFVLNEGISEKVCQVTRKYTAQAFLALLSGKFRRYKTGHFFFFLIFERSGWYKMVLTWMMQDLLSKTKIISSLYLSKLNSRSLLVTVLCSLCHNQPNKVLPIWYHNYDICELLVCLQAGIDLIKYNSDQIQLGIFSKSFSQSATSSWHRHQQRKFPLRI